jgi:transcriptional regulator with XRE-family HTH domain
MIRAVRRTRRLSQRELAAIAGIPASTLGRIEAGRTDPRVATLVRLVRAAGYELVVCDQQNRLLAVDEEHERLVDRAGRQFPAHLTSLKTPHPFDGEWWGWGRIAWWPGQPKVPEYIYRRRRELLQLPRTGPRDNRLRVWDDAT